MFVSAQGGSGKTVTTLLLFAKSKRVPLWIGLDRYDNSPAVFYKQLATGLYALNADNKNMHALLTDPSFSRDARGTYRGAFERDASKQQPVRTGFGRFPLDHKR